jgi:hypothetical protein
LQQAQNLFVHPNNFDSDGNTKKDVSPLIMSEEEYEAKLGQEQMMSIVEGKKQVIAKRLQIYKRAQEYLKNVLIFHILLTFNDLD